MNKYVMLGFLILSTMLIACEDSLEELETESARKL